MSPQCNPSSAQMDADGLVQTIPAAEQGRAQPANPAAGSYQLGTWQPSCAVVAVWAAGWAWAGLFEEGCPWEIQAKHMLCTAGPSWKPESWECQKAAGTAPG